MRKISLINISASTSDILKLVRIICGTAIIITILVLAYLAGLMWAVLGIVGIIAFMVVATEDLKGY